MDSSDAPPSDKASHPHLYPSWVMLDPYTRLNCPPVSLDYPEEHFRATYATEKTSSGDDVGVFLRAVSPTGASRLYVSWAPRSRIESSVPGFRPAGGVADRWDRSYGREPRVVAAHGHSILLQLALEKTRLDFFVYTAHSDGPPSLWRLPRCDQKFTDGAVSSRGLEYMFRLENIGILCSGDNDIVVADLKILPKEGNAYGDNDTPVQAGLCLYRNGVREDNWEATIPRIQHQRGQGECLMWWQTDAVIPFGDCLCYIDYFRGIIFVDLRSDCPELRFVQLPVKTPLNDPVHLDTGLRGCPAISRSICVTNGGMMKFVEVVTTGSLVLGSSSYDPTSFTINLWILKKNDMTWERQTTMQDTELWSLPGYGNLLRVTPSFPLVSMEDPSVIYFVLNSRSCEDNKIWVIVLDMSKRIVQSSVQYSEVRKNSTSESDGNMACRNIASNRAFLACEISKYLYVPRTRKRRNLG